MRVLLAGGSGLVGSLLTERLLRRPDIALLSLARTPRQSGELAVDFEALAADPTGIIAGLVPNLAQQPIDIGISCLGTTIGKAGSQAAMRRIDHDYVLATAQAAKAQGARQFILMSSVGAGGNGFYLQLKGEIERSLAGLGFARLDILRPSLLLGQRAERRLGEKLWQIASPLLNPLLLGPLEKYRAIPADTVAAAIARLIGATEPGMHVHEYRGLVELVGG